MINRHVMLNDFNYLSNYISTNGLKGLLTSDLKSDLITLVSICILPLTATLVVPEAIAASNQPRRSDLTSIFNSVTSITYVPMSLWLPKASMR